MNEYFTNYFVTNLDVGTMYVTNLEEVAFSVVTNDYPKLPHKSFFMDSPPRIEIMIVVVVASLWAKWSRRK